MLVKSNLHILNIKKESHIYDREKLNSNHLENEDFELPSYKREEVGQKTKDYCVEVKFTVV